MKTFAVFAAEFVPPDGVALSAIVNLVGGYGQIPVSVCSTAPRLIFGAAPTLWFACRDDFQNFWNLLGEGGCPIFTTAPADRLDEVKWPLIVSNGNGLGVSVERPECDTFAACWKDYGPYWRRFLIIRRGTPAGLPAQFGAAVPADSCPLYTRLKAVANYAAGFFAATRQNLLGEPQAVVLPPWDEANADSNGEDYWDMNQGCATGLQARRHLRFKTKQDKPRKGEPTLITLWRAMDDAVLRPEMRIGTQIELAGLPAQRGAEGEPTHPRLLLAPLRGDAAPEDHYWREFLRDDTGPGLVQAVRQALSSDIANAFGCEHLPSLVQGAESNWNPNKDLKSPPTDVDANASVFKLINAIANLDVAMFGAPFLQRCNPNGLNRESVSVRLFWTHCLRPPSCQLFHSAYFWERYVFLKIGCLHELTQSVERQPNQRLDAIRSGPNGYPYLDEVNHTLRVEVCPSADEDPNNPAILHAALLMPLGTRIIWGGVMRFDHCRSTLDSGAVLL